MTTAVSSVPTLAEENSSDDVEVVVCVADPCAGSRKRPREEIHSDINSTQQTANATVVVASARSSKDGEPEPSKPAVIETLSARGVVSSSLSTDPTGQRKRRVSNDDVEQIPNIPIDKLQANPIVKCISKPGKITKKPQLKYDPDVPMTKEEAAIWRREQRRKRNRESAAASRQRQRDRIVELEAEVDEWREKYDRIMHQVRQLERVTGTRAAPAPAYTARDVFRPAPPPPPPHPYANHAHNYHQPHPYYAPPRSPAQPPLMAMPPHHHHIAHPRTPSKAEPRIASPGHHAKASPVVSPVAAARPYRHHHQHHRRHYHLHADDDFYGPTVSPYASPQDESSSDEHEDHKFNWSFGSASKQSSICLISCGPSKITIPAVKITADAVDNNDNHDDDDAHNASFPALSLNDSLLPPDLCVSVPSKLEPMEQALLEEAAEHVLSVSSRDGGDQKRNSNHGQEEHPEDPFGEFLMDAVDWL